MKTNFDARICALTRACAKTAAEETSFPQDERDSPVCASAGVLEIKVGEERERSSALRASLPGVSTGRALC